MTKQVLEIVEFKLKDGVSVDQFIEATQATAKFVTELEGFISRKTCRNDADLWMDVVQWKDIATANAAAVKFSQAEEVGPMMSMINGETVRMLHLPVENEM